MSGTGGVSLGRSMPCAQYSGSLPLCVGRSDQTWTSRTGPIAPSQIHSLISRLPSKAMPWLPIWVATLASRAALARARASYTVRVSGFSQ